MGDVICGGNMLAGGVRDSGSLRRYFFPSRLRAEQEIIVGAAGNRVSSYSISLNGLEST